MFNIDQKKRREEEARRRREQEQRASDTTHVATTTVLSDSSGPAHAPLDSCHHADSSPADGGSCGGGGE